MRRAESERERRGRVEGSNEEQEECNEGRREQERGGRIKKRGILTHYNIHANRHTYSTRARQTGVREARVTHT